MQRGYRCVLTEPTGERFDPCFVPDLTINSRTAQVARRPATPSAVKFAVDLYGAFPVKRLFSVVLRVFCSERERPFFVPSPAIRSPERAEGVKGPKR
jgi:hypothetical protein